MARAKRLILVVEDGPTEREALARVLRLEGYEVLTAASPAEALTLLDRPVDLVVSDLCMGKQSGIDLLQTWRTAAAADALPPCSPPSAPWTPPSPP